MKKFDVVIGLERLADARTQWRNARAEFDTGYNKALLVLVHEGLREFMTPTEMAKALGVQHIQMRKWLRRHGIDPRAGKRVLSESSAKALRENAALLGVKPHEMDLTSPLAYLPMGNDLRNQLQDEQASRVTEFPETEPVATGLWCVNCEYLEDPDDCPPDYGQCKGCGCSPLDHTHVRVERQP